MATTADANPQATAPPAPARMTVPEHIGVVREEGSRFANAARDADLDAPVTGCPGWTVRDLVRHLGEIHLWAAANVAGRPGATLDLEDRSDLRQSWPELAEFWPDDDELIDWYLRTNRNLVQVLESAPADVAAPTFLPAPSPLAMWARRQAHETSIHRFDAQSAAGSFGGFEPTVAADGVDELLYAFYESATKSEGRLPVTNDHLIQVHSVDTNDRWFMMLGPRTITATPGGGDADLTISGTAADLYVSLWNRGDDTTIDTAGDKRLLALWHEHTGVRWNLA